MVKGLIFKNLLFFIPALVPVFSVTSAHADSNVLYIQTTETSEEIHYDFVKQMEYIEAHIPNAGDKYDFIARYTATRTVGHINSGYVARISAFNIGRTNPPSWLPYLGKYAQQGRWGKRLRSSPHMNDGTFSTPTTDQGVGNILHEVGHHWGTYWSYASNIPLVAMRQGPAYQELLDWPIYWHLGGGAHNGIYTTHPGIMRSGPADDYFEDQGNGKFKRIDQGHLYFNPVSLYAMGLISKEELDQRKYSAILNYKANNYWEVTGDAFPIKYEHLQEALRKKQKVIDAYLEDNPEKKFQYNYGYIHGNGERFPHFKDAVRHYKTLVVVFQGPGESLNSSGQRFETPANDLARAWFDATEGRSTNIASVSNDDTPPSLTLNNAPANNSEISGNITFTGTVSDASGINALYFSENSGVLKKIPYSGNSFSYTWDTSQLDAGTHSIRLTALDNVGNDSVFQVTLKVGDNDKDGISNRQENIDGSDPDDAGSFMPQLSSPALANWNGFLDFVNVVELINPSVGETTKGNIFIYNSKGRYTSAIPFILKPGRQKDFILNAHTDFKTNSYGSVKVVFNGELNGRVAYYRTKKNSDGFEFAFSAPLSKPSLGTTAVTYNTINPSIRPGERYISTANWLSISNFSDSSVMFKIRSYDINGKRIKTRNVKISALGRVDMDGGHGFNDSEIGFHKIIPENDTTPYSAFVTRYGSNPADRTGQTFRYAFPVYSRPGNGRPVVVPITQSKTVASWLEMLNPTDAEVEVSMEFYDKEGNLKKTLTIDFEANSQKHINVSNYLTAKENGSVRIVPNKRNSLLVNSMVYNLDSENYVNSLYASKARESYKGRLLGSYNLFLGMENSLHLVNTDDSTLTVEIKVKNSKGKVKKTYSIPAHSSKTITLKPGDSFGNTKDRYGVIEITTDRSKSLISDLVRIRKVNGKLDFAMPTLVQ